LEVLLWREVAGIAGIGESLSKLSSRLDVFARPRPKAELQTRENFG